MNHILTQLYIIATVCLIIRRTPIIRKVKWIMFQRQNTTARKVLRKGNEPWHQISIKPFDCPLCLTFWVSVAINCYLLSIPEAVGIASINALVASELEKYLVK